MAQITINIPDAAMPRVIDAWGAGYSSTLPDGSPNPQTKAQYARAKIISALKNRVVIYESGEASRVAARSAKQKAESEIAIS
jgi:hypothetical protein